VSSLFNLLYWAQGFPAERINNFAEGIRNSTFFHTGGTELSKIYPVDPSAYISSRRGQYLQGGGD